MSVPGGLQPIHRCVSNSSERRPSLPPGEYIEASGEWVQDRHGYFWEEAEVNDRLEKKMVSAFKNVLQTPIKYKTDMRTAAYIVAINRVATVTRLRGMYA